VGLEVERAFHLYLFKKTTIDLKRKAIQLNETHKKMAINKRRSGLAAESDVTEFDLKDATLRSDLLLLEQENEEARVTLKRLLGEEIGSNIEPVGDLQHQHLKGNLLDLVKRIKNESEPVLLGAKDVLISNLETKAAQSKWLPKVDVEIAAGYLPWDLRQVDAGTAMVGGKIVAKLDLFSGFDTMYERKENEAKKLRQEAELKNSLLLAMTDTENAYRKISTIQARVDLEQENESRSQKYYAAVMNEYRRGIKNSADLKVAADGLFEASLKREAFKFDFLNSRIDLERALGGKVEIETIQE
jgi:outer membrane protein TolC